MIKVAVAGCGGRMGSAVVDAVEAAEDMELICGIDPSNPVKEFPVYPSLDEALSHESFEVLVDFTQPDVVAQTLSVALPAGLIVLLVRQVYLTILYGALQILQRKERVCFMRQTLRLVRY